MKKALEAVLVLAVLALGVYVVRQGLARRELAVHPPGMNPALAPGADGDASPEGQRRGVQGLPMVKLSRPAKPSRRTAAVPPPAAP